MGNNGDYFVAIVATILFIIAGVSFGAMFMPDEKNDERRTAFCIALGAFIPLMAIANSELSLRNYLAVGGWTTLIALCFAIAVRMFGVFK